MKRFLSMLMICCLVSFLGTTAMALNVELFETDVRSAFKDLAYEARVTILVDDYVEGSMTLSLEDATVEEIIRIMCLKGEYDYKKLDDNLYIVGPVDPDSSTFQKHALTRRIKLDYADSEDVAGLLSHYGDYIQAKGNVIAVRAWPVLAEKITEDIAKMDSPVKQIEVQLLASEGSEKSFGEFGLELDASWGKGLEKLGDIFSVSIGRFAIGATSQNDLKAALTLQILNERGEAEVTGSPKIRVLEGHEAYIKFAEVRHIISVIDRKGPEFFYDTFIEKEEVEAETGLKVKVNRVTSRNEIIFDFVEVNLGEILETGQRTKSGEILRVNKRSARTTVILENYETIKLATMTIQRKKKLKRFPPYTSGETELIRLDLYMTANVIGTPPPPEYEGLERFMEGFNVEAPKQKGFISRHPILTLLIVGGIAAVALQ